MASIRKRSGGWRAEIRRRGVYVSRTFATKAAAVAWSAQVEAEIDAGRRGEMPRRSFVELCERYRLEVSPTKRGARWENLRLARIAATALFRHRLCHTITPDDIGAWRDARRAHVSDSTVRRELNLLGSLFETARREWRWVGSNPVRDVRKPQEAPARRRGVGQAEIDALLHALGWVEDGPLITKSQQVAAAFLLAIETAMRAGELLGLTWLDVDLTRRVARLPKTKNGDAREVPLSSRAVALFGMMQKDGGNVFAVSGASLDALFRKARTRAGLVDVHFHDSRSEALTRLADRLDVLELARMVGHRDPRSLMVYYRKSAAEIAEKLG